MTKTASNKLKSKEKPAVSAPAASSGRQGPGDAPPELNGQHRWVYAFGGGKAEGRSDMRNLLGGKGAGLAEMANLGLPVPPGFTITTEVCTHYYANDKSYPPELESEITEALAAVEQQIGAKFGDPAKPLLVSVRSGARASM